MKQGFTIIVLYCGLYGLISFPGALSASRHACHCYKKRVLTTSDNTLPAVNAPVPQKPLSESSGLKKEATSPSLYIKSPVSNYTPKPDQRLLVNQLEAEVCGPERSRVFSSLDYQRRGIDGRYKKLIDLISEELIYQDALRIKMPVDDAVVKAHLRRVMQSFGLKAGDEDSIFAQEGYSYAEGFEQFRMMYGVNAMIEHHIMQQLFVSEEEVHAYYTAHPIIKQAAILVQTASIPFGTEPEGRLKTIERISNFVQKGMDIGVQWSQGYWVKKNELSAQLQPFLQQAIGSIIEVEGPADMYLYRLLNRKEERLVPLSKRYKSIVETLRKPKYEALLAQYRKRLLDNATVVYVG